MMRIDQVSPDNPEAVRLLKQLSDALASITGDSGTSSFDPADMGRSGTCFVIAYDVQGQAAGCGAYRPLSQDTAELKRMYAVPGGRGVGVTILNYLEAKAISDGYREIWLETRLVNRRAVSFYQKTGYRRIANFGKYVGRPEAACFAKRL